MAINQPARTVFCKPYHAAKRKQEKGRVRGKGTRKSLCPAWASDSGLQRALIQDAIPDPAGALDMYGDPKRVWNAVNGRVFVGVSTHAQRGEYDCYPHDPVTGLHAELSRRRDRTLEDLLGTGGKP